MLCVCILLPFRFFYTHEVLFIFFFFFFNDTATTEIYTLSLHDALPIFSQGKIPEFFSSLNQVYHCTCITSHSVRSEEHTSELQSQSNLVCRLLLEKKKNTSTITCIKLIK